MTLALGQVSCDFAQRTDDRYSAIRLSANNLFLLHSIVRSTSGSVLGPVVGASGKARAGAKFGELGIINFNGASWNVSTGMCSSVSDENISIFATLTSFPVSFLPRWHTTSRPERTRRRDRQQRDRTRFCWRTHSCPIFDSGQSFPALRLLLKLFHHSTRIHRRRNVPAARCGRPTPPVFKRLIQRNAISRL